MSDWREYMMRYKESRDFAGEDHRSTFANDIAQLLVDKHGTIDGALVEWEEFSAHLHTHVRNIYERADDEIPMEQLYHLISNEWNNFDFDDEQEYLDAVSHCRAVCEKWYITDRISDGVIGNAISQPDFASPVFGLLDVVVLENMGWSYNEKCAFTGIPSWENGNFNFYPAETMDEKNRERYNMRPDSIGVVKYHGGEFSMITRQVHSVIEIINFFNCLNDEN